MARRYDMLHYAGTSPGPHLLITGAVHGNEPCGPQAIHRVGEALERGEIQITQGRLTLIPVCNPAAYEQGTRYYERNMNRHFYPKDPPDTYEDERINKLAPELAKADYLLDIHSYSRGGPPFVFVDTSVTEDLKFARMLGISESVHGFQAAHRAAGIVDDDAYSMGTAEYTRANGGHALTLECGRHDDPQSIAVAWRAICGVLYHLELAEISEALADKIPPLASAEDMACTQATEVVFKDRPGRFLADWGHLQTVAPSTPIAEYDDGTRIHAPAHETRLIMPKDTAPVGEEWIYFGRAAGFEA